MMAPSWQSWDILSNDVALETIMASCRWLSAPVRPRARHGGFALMSVLALLTMLLPLPPTSLLATRGYAQANDDACPEDNGSYQRACLLGVTVNLEMTQSPRPYRMTVQNWAGEPLAATVGLANNDVERTLQFKPPAPGSYYMLVDALFDDADAVSPTEPYTLVYRPVYPGPIPKIAYAADFRQPSREGNLRRLGDSVVNHLGWNIHGRFA